jgi:hypothetical protein
MSRGAGDISPCAMTARSRVHHPEPGALGWWGSAAHLHVNVPFNPILPCACTICAVMDPEYWHMTLSAALQPDRRWIGKLDGETGSSTSSLQAVNESRR